jgi:hypothetical protein
MNTSLSAEQIKRLRKVFRMPAVQSVASRKTSITNAFVSAIIPVVCPTPNEIAEALSVLGMKAETVSCIYCGDKCNAWDHLRPLVIGRRPTGYISEIANLVPACQPCNSSKGNSQWREWMVGRAAQSPTTRGVHDVQMRIGCLEAFERWRQPTKVDFEAIVGHESYEAYWQELDRVIGEMERSQSLANKLRAEIANAGSKWQVRPVVGERPINDPPSRPEKKCGM